VIEGSEIGKDLTEGEAEALKRFLESIGKEDGR
jgi:hypothetical protein